MVSKTLPRLLVFLFALAASGVAQAQDVKLTRVKSSGDQAIAALLLADIYKRAGLNLTVSPVPAERSHFMALSGESDGEVARIAAYAERSHSLVKVEPAYYYLVTTAVAKSGRGIKISSKADLKKFKVGIVRGAAYAEVATSGLQGVEVANNFESLYQMLEANRIDVILDAGVNVTYYLKKFNFRDTVPVGELARHDLFNMLTPANTELAPKLSEVLKALIASGELKKLQKKYEDEFFRSAEAP